MDPQLIRDVLFTDPFKPFEMETVGGKTISVRKYDNLLFTDSKKTIVVADGEHIHVVQADHITSIHFIDQAAA